MSWNYLLLPLFAQAEPAKQSAETSGDGGDQPQVSESFLPGWLQYKVLDAPLWEWIIEVGIAVGLFVLLEAVLGITRKWIERRSQKTAHRYDDYLMQVLRRTQSFAVLAAAVYLTLQFRGLWGGQIDGQGTLQQLCLVLLFVQVGLWGMALLDEALTKALELAKFTEAATETAMGVTRFFGMVAIWGIVVMLILSALGIQITPLLAGLGVGGVAVAFALQAILGDVFCSVAIVLDRPFEVGDFIIVGDYMGTVSHIGIKTTRLRALSGEQLIFANSDLIGSRIQNYKRMEERRVAFSFGVLYRTTADQLEQIPPMVKEVIEGVEQVRFDRAHFKSFGDSSLDFEVVYYVLSGNYNLYMDIQQQINLGIFRRLEELGVEMAFPSRSVYLEPSSGLESLSKAASVNGSGSSN